MNPIRVTLEQTPPSPGGMLAGSVSWNSDMPPERVEIQLLWSTSGKGTRDVSVVESHIIHTTQRSGREQFAFTLPAGPYSFSGRLISLIWCVEVILVPGDHVDRAEFVLSPTGEEIVLGSVDD